MRSFVPEQRQAHKRSILRRGLRKSGVDVMASGIADRQGLVIVIREVKWQELSSESDHKRLIRCSKLHGGSPPYGSQATGPYQAGAPLLHPILQSLQIVTQQIQQLQQLEYVQQQQLHQLQQWIQAPATNPAVATAIAGSAVITRRDGPSFPDTSCCAAVFPCPARPRSCKDGVMEGGVGRPALAQNRENTK